MRNKKRYVMVSDIHGCFDKLQAALKKVDFNPNIDTIVSLGDPFDRGPQNAEVLEFLMSCPSRILIWGNHDGRLYNLLSGRDLFITWADYHNGLLATFQSFCDNPDLTSIETGLVLLRSDERCGRICGLLWQYFDECKFAAEWKDLIATHAWVPLNIEDWRQASRQEWMDATWTHVANAVKKEIFPEKRLVVGHWHAWRLRGDPLDAIDYSTYQTDKIVVIDGCTNAEEGLVNTFIYETDEEPKIY